MDHSTNSLSPLQQSSNFNNSLNSQSFTQKLFSMVSDSNYDHIIRWSSDGLSFEVIDPRGMETEILPKYFRHDRFPSMVRQLNFYNFKKIGSQRASWIYQHNYFQRGKRDLLAQLRRKTNNSTLFYPDLEDRDLDPALDGGDGRRRAYSIQSDQSIEAPTTPLSPPSPASTIDLQSSAKGIPSSFSKHLSDGTSTDLFSEPEESPVKKLRPTIYDSWNHLASYSHDHRSSSSSPSVENNSHLREVCFILIPSLDNSELSSDNPSPVSELAPESDSGTIKSTNFIERGMTKSDDSEADNSSVHTSPSAGSSISKPTASQVSSFLNSNISSSFNLVKHVQTVISSTNLTPSFFLSLLELLNRLFPSTSEGFSNSELDSGSSIKSFEKNLLSQLSNYKDVVQDLAMYMEYLNHQIEMIPLFSVVMNKVSNESKSTEQLVHSSPQSKVIVEHFVRHALNILNNFIHTALDKIRDESAQEQLNCMMNSLKYYQKQLNLIHETFY